MRRTETCYSCRFWFGFGPRERGPKGHCRRFPPVVTDRFPDGAFATTKSDDWCGEWRLPAARREEGAPAPRGPAAPHDAAPENGGTLYDEL